VIGDRLAGGALQSSERLSYCWWSVEAVELPGGGSQAQAQW
jgi:hypothetical protein